MADGAADDSKRDHRYTSFMVAVWGGDLWAKAMSREAHLHIDGYLSIHTIPPAGFAYLIVFG